jgi:hypothetical protein
MLFIQFQSREVSLSADSMETLHLDFFEENYNYARLEWFITPCCLWCKVNLSVSFHIQRINIFARILLDFRCLARAAWRDNVSFYWLWYSHSLHIFEVPYFIVVRGVHFFPNFCHPVDLWTFQMSYWIQPIGSFMSLRKWTFKQWIRKRSCRKHQNKGGRLRTAKVFSARPARAENSVPPPF